MVLNKKINMDDRYLYKLLQVEEDNYEDEYELAPQPVDGHSSKFNYQQILHFVKSSWLAVEAELSRGCPKIRYYKASVCC
jgi:hypothetical protein